ncbi:hypothetical protein [Streptomyces mirabilis]|uniref:hypothetical protein n=1 Tax=Streptomyces mirabilis TaxID=68239 RepID=UPI0022523224|nr:hypothetical protein [Streptomyces mirabilis]MCX4429464.1 hypothetical protein [Streptomyces mirabilis]
MTLPHGADEDALDVELDPFDMTDEHALIMWRFGGFGTAENFPGARLAMLRMLRGTGRSTRKALARIFASLAPHSGVRAVLALLLVVAVRPAPVALPTPTPRALSPQRRCHRPSPARAP